MEMTQVDWIGSVGVFLILLAYFLNVAGKIKTEDSMFILLNLVGAGMACSASIMLKYWPFIILDAAWVLVSLWSLFGWYKRDKELRAES